MGDCNSIRDSLKKVVRSPKLKHSLKCPDGGTSCKARKDTVLAVENIVHFRSSLWREFFCFSAVSRIGFPRLDILGSIPVSGSIFSIN
jgi:hypothetical protein